MNPDFVLPLNPTDTLISRGTILSLCDAAGTRWSVPVGTGRVVTAAVVADGHAVAVRVAGRGGRDLVLVIALCDGAIERRVILDRE